MQIARKRGIFFSFLLIFIAAAIQPVFCGATTEVDLVRRIFIDDPKKVLGYDPDTDQISESPAADPLSQTIVLCSHGFGDSKYSARALSPHTGTINLLPPVVRGRFVSFNFRDHRVGGAIPLFSLRHTNLGGEPDARVVLFHIIKCFCKGYTNIMLFGHSRGCAATIRALDMLTDPYKYRSVWTDFGFSQNGVTLCCEVIQAVQAAVGRVYLARPLLDVKKAFWCAGKNVTGAFLAPVTASVLRAVACTLGSCSLRVDEPITILKNLLQRAQFDFYLFFAPNDAVVGNFYDDLIMRELAHDPANRSTLHACCTGIVHTEFRDAATALGEYLVSL